MYRDKDTLKEMLVVLHAEREALSAGDYRKLHELVARKRVLMVEIGKMEAREVDRLREIMHLSVQNGIMIEAALRFWKRAHARLIGLQTTEAGTLAYGGPGAGSMGDEYNR